MTVHQGRITVISWIPTDALPAPLFDFFDDDGVASQQTKIDDAVTQNAFRCFHDASLKIVTDDDRTVASFEPLSTFRANPTTLSMYAIIRNAAVGGAAQGFISPLPGGTALGFISGLLFGLLTGAIGQLISFDPENFPKIEGTKRVTVGDIEGIQMWSIQGTVNNFADNTAGFVVNVPPIFHWLEVTVLANGCKRFIVRDLSAFPKHSIYLDDDLWKETTPNFDVFSDVDSDFNPWINQAGYISLKGAQLRSTDGLGALGYFRGDFNQSITDCDIPETAVPGSLPEIGFKNRDGQDVDVNVDDPVLKEPLGAAISSAPGIVIPQTAKIQAERLATDVIADLLRENVLSRETLVAIADHVRTGGDINSDAILTGLKLGRRKTARLRNSQKGRDR